MDCDLCGGADCDHRCVCHTEAGAEAGREEFIGYSFCLIVSLC